MRHRATKHYVRHMGRNNMQTGYLIQSVIEFVLVAGIVVGLIYEDKLAAWEVRTWRRITTALADYVGKHGR